MSDTPRTEAEVARFKGPTDDLITIDANFAAQLERELNAANDRIKRLEEALGCVVVDCNHLHHRKKHQHRSGEPCPVEGLIRKAKEAKQ